MMKPSSRSSSPTNYKYKNSQGDCNNKKLSRIKRRASRGIIFSLVLILAASNYEGMPPHFMDDEEQTLREWLARQNSYIMDQIQRCWKRLSLSSLGGWDLVLSTRAPYNDMTPQLEVVWARGWYNAFMPPSTVPMEYYNERGRDGSPTHEALLEQWFPPTLCGPLWFRTNDVPWWINHVLPNVTCNVTIITGDAIDDVPGDVEGAEKLLESPFVERWYAQNVVHEGFNMDRTSDLQIFDADIPGNQSKKHNNPHQLQFTHTLHSKLSPIPVGLPIHYGFDGSPSSAHTVKRLAQIRANMIPYEKRQRRTILFDKGTTTDEGPRALARNEAATALEQCRNNGNGGAIEFMENTPTVETWKRHYSTHHFAIAVRGTGWDTYRTWEFLFFETVPILKAPNPMTDLLLPAHVPVVVVQEWSELCSWTGAKYDAMVEQYQGWIQHARQWLHPSLWVPRNQTKMDELCQQAPGCRPRLQRQQAQLSGSGVTAAIS